MRLGFVGLGHMGTNMVRRLLRDGHEVVAYNRTAERTRQMAEEGALAAFSPTELVSRLDRPRAIWVMVPSGDATEAQVLELAGCLEAGDTVVDGGDSNFRDSARRHARLAEQGIAFVDVGVTGGATAGGSAGYSLSIGGDAESIARLDPVFRSLAPEAGYLHVGGPGAGHYVKMVHNGIAYGLMQAYAEGFEILHASDYSFPLTAIARTWNRGSGIRSWLLELTANALAADQDLHHQRGWVPDSGEGRWTVQEAIDSDVPAPVITLALLSRLRSRQDESYGSKVLAALRNEFSGDGAKT